MIHIKHLAQTEFRMSEPTLVKFSQPDASTALT
jgi:hypothetical protein